jgi:hypothetical protein
MTAEMKYLDESSEMTCIVIGSAYHPDICSSVSVGDERMFCQVLQAAPKTGEHVSQYYLLELTAHFRGFPRVSGSQNTLLLQTSPSRIRAVPVVALTVMTCSPFGADTFLVAVSAPHPLPKSPLTVNPECHVSNFRRNYTTETDGSSKTVVPAYHPPSHWCCCGWEHE